MPEFSAFGAVRQPAGSALPGIAPSNAYSCADGMVVIGGNGDSIFKRLMQAIGRDDLATDAELAHNPGRVKRVSEIDEAIGAWTSRRTVDEVLAVLNDASVPVGRIYNAKDIAQDPHYRARDMILPVTTHDGLTVEVPGIVPKLSRTPGPSCAAAPCWVRTPMRCCRACPPRFSRNAAGGGSPGLTGPAHNSKHASESRRMVWGSSPGLCVPA